MATGLTIPINLHKLKMRPPVQNATHDDSQAVDAPASTCCSSSVCGASKPSAKAEHDHHEYEGTSSARARGKHDAPDACGSAVCAAPAAAPSADKLLLRIPAMDCPTEEALIRKKLGDMPGVSALEFNLIQRQLTFTHAPEVLPKALAALKSLGFEAVEQGSGRAVSAVPTADAEASAKTYRWPMAVSGVAAVVAEAVQWQSGSHWLVVALAH